MDKKKFKKLQTEMNELAQKLVISAHHFCRERGHGPNTAVTALFAAALYLVDTQITEEDDSEEEIDNKVGAYLDTAQTLNEGYMFKEDPCKTCTEECELRKPHIIN